MPLTILPAPFKLATLKLGFPDSAVSENIVPNSFSSFNGSLNIATGIAANFFGSVASVEKYKNL
ncbi:hypothetical protein [Candidatus Aquarickettsia rohweri]|uniref:hypothetical protein n=1 Tax=Candidatus Aquarickettsia rohweri TaxID=2602574 RepID=UPI001F0B9BBE|nr:hypothetical protein [Candidatus Aquarickettsia rohweri]